MAESQDQFSYDEDVLASLKEALSEPRFSTYLNRAEKDGGAESHAFAFYLWNARLCKAFLYPLHVAEISTRNSMNSAFSKRHCSYWMVCDKFHDSLTAESLEALSKSISRLRKNANRSLKDSEMVACLTFDFWSNLFRKEYEELWTEKVSGTDKDLIHFTFPNLPKEKGRHYVQALVSNVNWFRNRVAHHEPIFNLNHYDVLKSIYDLISLTGKDVKKWTQSHCTVSSVVRNPPKLDQPLPGLPLAGFKVPKPVFMDVNDKLSSAMLELCVNKNIFILNKSQPAEIHVINQAGVIKHITENTLDGYIALDDHLLSDLIKDGRTVIFSEINLECSTGDALFAFFNPKINQSDRPQALSVYKVEKGVRKVVGIISKPEIRF